MFLHLLNRVAGCWFIGCIAGWFDERCNFCVLSLFSLLLMYHVNCYVCCIAGIHLGILLHHNLVVFFSGCVVIWMYNCCSVLVFSMDVQKLTNFNLSMLIVLVHSTV